VELLGVLHGESVPRKDFWSAPAMEVGRVRSSRIVGRTSVEGEMECAGWRIRGQETVRMEDRIRCRLRGIHSR
jgi:hypothetical protein